MRTSPPPANSARIYVRLPARDLAMFRFVLEAYDNLGYATVVDRQSAVLQVVHSPDQTPEVLQLIHDLKASGLPIATVDVPRLS